MRLETRLIKENHKYDFYMFQQHPFLAEWGEHVIFALVNGDEDVALAYAWNLESLNDAASAEYIEILLLEAKVQGLGYGSALLDLLQKRYEKIGASNVLSEVEGFWLKCGFDDSGTSQIDAGRVMIWQSQSPAAGRRRSNERNG